MRRLLPVLLAVALGLAVAVLAACGDTNGLIPSGDASQINSGLDNVSSAVQAQHCTSATRAVQRVEQRIAALPASVDTTIRSGLSDKVAELGRRAAEECTRTTSTSSQTQSTTTSTPTTSSNTTSTETSTTNTTPSTPTNTTPSTPTNTVPAHTGTTGGSSGGISPGGGSSGGGSSGSGSGGNGSGGSGGTGASG